MILKVPWRWKFRTEGLTVKYLREELSPEIFLKNGTMLSSYGCVISMFAQSLVQNSNLEFKVCPKFGTNFKSWIQSFNPNFEIEISKFEGLNLKLWKCVYTLSKFQLKLEIWHYDFQNLISIFEFLNCKIQNFECCFKVWLETLNPNFEFHFETLNCKFEVWYKLRTNFEWYILFVYMFIPNISKNATNRRRRCTKNWRNPRKWGLRVTPIYISPHLEIEKKSLPMSFSVIMLHFCVHFLFYFNVWWILFMSMFFMSVFCFLGAYVQMFKVLC